MTQSDPGWELYRSFLGVLHEGSLSGAARALGLTQPTVGRHIAALEEALGQVLFTRSQSGFAPTEAAEALRPYAETLAATAAALRRAASGHGAGVRGSVRITASEVVGVEVLPPILSALARDEPELEFEVVLSNRLDDLLRGDADIAVRMTRPTQTALIARRVGTIDLGLHARRDYLERRGTPRTERELLDHALIGYDSDTALVRGFKKTVPLMNEATFSWRADSDLAQLAAIRAGFGLGVCQVPLARRDATLVRVLPRFLNLPLETWITMHEDLRDSPRCRAAFDALVTGITQYIQG